MADIAFVHGDATWTQLRERCLTDLYWFAGVVLKYGDKVHMNPRVHGLFCRVLERKTGVPEIDQTPHRKILMPREAGKSTLGTQAYVIQRILQHPNIAILIANERLENAQAFLSAIKGEFEHNQLLRELFPEIIPDMKDTTWAADRILVNRTENRKEPTIVCAGTGAALAGMHPDLIVCDDIFSREAMENARSGNIDLTGKINRWIAQLRPILNAWAEPFPEILFIGTHWYAGDPYHYVEDAFGYGEPDRVWRIRHNLPDGESQTLTVRKRGDLVIFRRSAIEDGKTIWPENPKFTMDALAKFRLADPVLFACNMQNEPTDETIAVFKESWLRYYQWLDKQTLRFEIPTGKPLVARLGDLDTVFLVDPGGFGKRQGSDRMRPAVLVTSSTMDGAHIALLEAWSEPVSYQAMIDQILALATRYLPRRIAVEVAGQQDAVLELLQRTAKERRITVSFQAVRPESQEKDARILALEPYFQRGQMYVGTGAPFAEFREQYRTFPRGRRRDVLDALAYGPRVWKRIATGPQLMQERQRWERDLYLQRRGLVAGRV